MNQPLSIVNSRRIHPAVHLLQQWKSFMDGIDRLMCFYQSDDNGMIEGIEWYPQVRDALMPISLGEEAKAKLAQQLIDNTSYQWLRPELLPFTSRSRLAITQMDLFTESECLVLFIRSKAGEATILSYLFFRNDCSNFGMAKRQGQLETSHKAIIGKMASQFAKITLNSFISLNADENNFRQITRSLLETKQLEQQKQKDEFKNWKISWLDTYLREISQRDAVNYVMSEEAKSKLLENAHAYESIKKTIDKCISYICNLQLVQVGDEVLIEPGYIVFDNAVQDTYKETEASTNSRSSRTMHLLDRLETSAALLHQQGLSLTSAEVGANMPKPITAPAISDAVRKNRVRILQLFDQYPQRWPLIRQSFKPITNLQTRKNQFLSASG